MVVVFFQSLNREFNPSECILLKKYTVLNKCPHGFALVKVLRWSVYNVRVGFLDKKSVRAADASMRLLLAFSRFFRFRFFRRISQIVSSILRTC